MNPCLLSLSLLHCRVVSYLLLCAALSTASPRACAGERTSVDSFPHSVAFDLGDVEFEAGDSITIESVRGTDSTFKVGHTYCVSGTYTLASAAAADLAVFVTTTSRIATAVSDAQKTKVQKGSGKFSLVFELAVPGYPHVSFYPASSGSSFGGVYFGQGDAVLKNKGFSHRRAAQSLKNSGTRVSTGVLEVQNRSILEYLGAPVAPPTNLESAYTSEGLKSAMKSAAQKAGVALRQVEIDDSEFPFLVGLVTDEGDYPKLLEQIKQMPAYEEQGGVSSKTCWAINITPYRVFPLEAAQRIGRRMAVRESMLFDRLMTRVP